MEKDNYCPFGYPLVVFKSAIAHNTEAHDLLKNVMSLSTLITADKCQIIKTKRLLNEAVTTIKYCKLLRSYNLINSYDEHGVDLNEVRKAIKEYTNELHMHQKDLRKIYAKHNEMVNDLKKAINTYLSDNGCPELVNDLKKAINTYLSDNGCPEIKHVRQTETKDVGDIKGLPQIKEEQSLTTFNLSRVGVLTLIKKLSDEIKAKPNCNNFTITINTGVTKG